MSGEHVSARSLERYSQRVSLRRILPNQNGRTRTTNRLDHNKLVHEHYHEHYHEQQAWPAQLTFSSRGGIIFTDFNFFPVHEKVACFHPSQCGFTPQSGSLTQEDVMKHRLLSGGKVLCALLALPLLLSITLTTPLSATQRVVLVEEWENTG